MNMSIENQETFLLKSATNSVTKILSNDGGDYEEFRLLGYKNPVRISLETHYISATEPSRLFQCTI
jgi:hypothetical protein